ncbi:MAG: MFS transporter [Bacteroides sp.]
MVHKQERTVFAILLAISISHFLNDMMQSIIPAIYPMIKEKYGFSFGQIGVITFAFQMTSSLLQPFVGWFADRRPRPYSLSLGMLFTLTGIIALSFANSFVLILLSVSIIGWGSSVFHPSASRVAQMAAGTRNGLAQSIFQVGGNGGNALGPLLAAVIVIPFGQYAIAWFALAALLASATLFRVGGWYKRALVYASVKKREVSILRQPLSSRRVAWAVVVLVILVFSKAFYMSSMTSYFTFFLINKFGVSVQISQLCLFAFLAAVAIGTLLGGHLGDKYGRKYVIWGSILGAAPFTLILPYLSFSLTVFVAIIIGLVISSAFSAILVYATELKPGHVGMVAGMFYGFSFGLAGIGSAFFGWLADRTSIDFIFHISTLLPFLGIVAAFLPNIEPKRKRG